MTNPNNNKGNSMNNTANTQTGDPELDGISAVLVGGRWLPVENGTLTIARIRQPLVGAGLLLSFQSEGATVVVDPGRVDAVQTSTAPALIAPTPQVAGLEESGMTHPGLDPAAHGGNVPFRPPTAGIATTTVNQ